jgi:hypothetical protein
MAHGREGLRHDCSTPIMAVYTLHILYDAPKPGCEGKALVIWVSGSRRAACVPARQRVRTDCRRLQALWRAAPRTEGLPQHRRRNITCPNMTGDTGNIA